MPTSVAEGVVEEAGIRYYTGLKSPINGLPLVKIDMDVIVQIVKNIEDPLEEDDTFLKRVGDYLAHRFAALLVAVETERLLATDDSAFLSREEEARRVADAEMSAHEVVLTEIAERPSVKGHPYSGLFRYASEVLDVYFTADRSSEWVSGMTWGKEGLARFFYNPKVDRKRHVPKEIWDDLMFCSRRECRDPGCPCICHPDGRNKVLEMPLENFGSDTYEDLLLKWSYIVETVCFVLDTRANEDAKHHDAVIGQIMALEQAFEWVVLETWDPDVHIAMGALTRNMFYLTKAFVDF